MKRTFLTTMLGLLVGLLFTTNCEAQNHSLLTKIEETKLGNNQWDKISVMLPNPSFKIDKVVYQDNQLVVLFNYTTKKESNPQPYTFYLSDYKIDCTKVSADDTVYVLGRHKDDVSKLQCPTGCPVGQSSRLGDHKCPPFCPSGF